MVLNNDCTNAELSDIQKDVDLAHQVTKRALETFAKQMVEVLQVVNQTNWTPVIKAVQIVRDRIADIVSSLVLPGNLEEQKQKWIESHTQWGTMGWTYIPGLEFDLFDDPPMSVKEANKKMISLCTSERMKETFNRLRESKIKKEDLESAIFCYENRQYKACALLLFGLIESKMIRKQKKETKRRPIGVKAANVLKNRFEENTDEKRFYSILLCSNLIECITVFFADGKDFKKEPDLINRNFVSHGMNQRSVRKRDCIQLFLVLYNLMEFLSYDF